MDSAFVTYIVSHNVRDKSSSMPVLYIMRHMYEASKEKQPYLNDSMPFNGCEHCELSRFVCIGDHVMKTCYAYSFEMKFNSFL